jgi:hypothetical protein
MGIDDRYVEDTLGVGLADETTYNASTRCSNEFYKQEVVMFKKFIWALVLVSFLVPAA